ncbi:MAG TPA: hypothetical protein VFG86_26830 [Chloroflexota bacterium]|nr:hypothetical protein [Chloroflexota bacterium]
MLLLRWLPTVLLLVPWLVGPLTPSNDERIRDLAGGVSFRLLDWETVHLAQRATRLWQGLIGTGAAVREDDARLLREYFRPGAQRAQQRSSVEAALERVVTSAYEEQGLPRSEPVRSDRLFPPVLVTLNSPPNVLVISPRTELRVTGSVVLQGMDTAAQERLEASADSTGVASLVAPIGGLATYPSMVLEEDTAERVLTSVAHEWLHQYLIFYPLGAGYWNRQETREINETTADLVGQEIGSELARRYELRRPASARSAPTQPPRFDFRAFMGATRLHVEELLVAGQVEPAEAYMDGQRDELQRHGYTIRKLNQAYFALYGSYGGGPAASPANPVPDLLRHLRERSDSLADFVFQVRDVTTVDQLRAVVAHSEHRPG